MISDRLGRMLSIKTEKRIMIFGEPRTCELISLRGFLVEAGYVVYDYDDVERFRIVYEEQFKNSPDRLAVIVLSDIYVPYDIRRSFYEVDLSIGSFFPQLNAGVVKRYWQDWDIICFALSGNYMDLFQTEQTERYIADKVFSAENVTEYCREKTTELGFLCAAAMNYSDWVRIAEAKARIEYYAAMVGIQVDLIFADEAFNRFALGGYSSLNLEVNNLFPPILTKTMSMIASDVRRKVALIVMDGMSLFDFMVISRYFEGIDFQLGCAFAIIPTTTALSRQSLLAGKYPRELAKPFSLSDEEKEFRTHAARLGYAGVQVEYLRGYEANPNQSTRLVAVIVNETDDIVHGQRQGRSGMFSDMSILGKTGKLQGLISRLAQQGFQVFITSDHGNTQCKGIGGFRGGVEIESKSKRMIVLKDFAEISALVEENTIEYPGYFLPRGYLYRICKPGISFDSIGESVMTHGGMSLDEVVVPFIRIEGMSQA